MTILGIRESGSQYVRNLERGLKRAGRPSGSPKTAQYVRNLERGLKPWWMTTTMLLCFSVRQKPRKGIETPKAQVQPWASAQYVRNLERGLKLS